MSSKFQWNCPVPSSDHATVQLAHGGGGRLMRDLIEGLFFPAFSAGDVSSPSSRQPPHDSAVLPTEAARLAFTTDTFVVHPLFFPGGDIGRLAVYGTVNDLAMSGARPAFLSAGFIIEEGFSMETLRRIVASMADAARTAGVRIVTGDTKVVDRGRGDGVYINTAGIGWIPPGVEISPSRICPDDVILLSGDLGRHGMAVMSVREGLEYEGALESDCAPLAGLVEAMAAVGPDLHCLRDLTRGGLAAVLNEIALDVRLGIEIDETAAPVAEPVAAACELLGLDPLHVANEGRLAAFVAPAAADRVLEIMQKHPATVGPCRIGKTTDSHPGLVELRSSFGGRRILDLPTGEPMPRIC